MIREGSRQADAPASDIFAIASDHTDLALHALAHLALPAGDPARMSDGRYVAWASRELPPEAVQPIAGDAPLIAATWARDPIRSRGLFALPLVHASIDAFRRCAARELSSLRDDEVDDRAALATVRAADPTACELLRCAMALAAPAYAAAHRAIVSPQLAAALERARPWLSRALEAMPALGDHRVVLAHALGLHGRGLPATILVGAPLEWNELGPEHPAVIALHERAVIEATSEAVGSGARSEDLWVIAETRALAAVTEIVRGTELEAGHGAWLATLDMRSLDQAASRLGLDREAPPSLVARLRQR